ncbi:MAG TPA: hypothetical protein VGD18_07380, partial [Thiobacillaceae bacterium]
MTAGDAAAVVEYHAVELAADGCAGGAASDAPDQATENRAGETAESNADGSTDNAKGGAGFCTGCGSSHATGGPGAS